MLNIWIFRSRQMLCMWMSQGHLIRIWISEDQIKHMNVSRSSDDSHMNASRSNDTYECLDQGQMTHIWINLMNCIWNSCVVIHVLPINWLDIKIMLCPRNLHLVGEKTKGLYVKFKKSVNLHVWICLELFILNVKKYVSFFFINQSFSFEKRINSFRPHS